MKSNSSRRTRLARCMLAFFGLLLATATDSFAQLQDAQGSKDHPIISRYGGSVIIGYDARKFDEVELPMGPLERDAVTM